MSVDLELVRAAYRQADAAAEAAGVSVRLAEPGDMNAVVGLFERTWGLGRSPDRSLLLALDYAGNTVLIAVAEGRPVGAVLGFLGWNDGVHLHSHMAAVVPWLRSGGVGYAIKLFQRALCLEHGVTDMRWTFDPLIRRNAHFNLVKLGAEVVRFLPDFYGQLDDAITGNDHSDRFEVRWNLASPRVNNALTGVAPPSWTPTAGFELAPDFEQLRVAEPETAAAMRQLSRTVFTDAFLVGLRPELNAINDYVLTTDPVLTTDSPDGTPREA